MDYRKRKGKSRLFGYIVVYPPSVIATHLTEIIKERAHELIGRQDVKMLIDNVKEEHPAVVEELVPDILSLGEIQKVLSNLLKTQYKRYGNDFRNFSRLWKDNWDTHLLTEYVRQRLAGYITNKYVENGRQLNVVTLDNSVEETIMNSITKSETGSYLSLEPNTAQKILNNTLKAVRKLTNIGEQPIVLTAAIVRLYFKRLTEQLTRDLIVLAYNEIDPAVEVKTVEVVSM